MASGMDNGRVSGVYSDMRFGNYNSRPCSLRMAIWIICRRIAWLNELSDSIRDFIRASERLGLSSFVPAMVYGWQNSIDLIDLDEPMLT